MTKDSKGLLLYFSSADQFFKMSDEELGRFIKKELAWYMGETAEPEYDEPRSDCMHSRIKEQVQLRGYNAQKQKESREKKKAYQQPKAEVKAEIDEGDDDGFDKALQELRELYQTGDWFYDHKLNDVKNKYGKEYATLKQMVER